MTVVDRVYPTLVRGDVIVVLKRFAGDDVPRPGDTVIARRKDLRGEVKCSVMGVKALPHLDQSNGKVTYSLDIVGSTASGERPPMSATARQLSLRGQARQLSLRGQACDAFRWAPGMLGTDGWRVRKCLPPTNGLEATIVWVNTYGLSRITVAGVPLEDGHGPDMDDRATLGCFLGLVREAWGYSTLSTCVVHFDGCDLLWETVWAFGGSLRHGLVLTAKSEAEALVLALEGAP